MFLLAGLFFAFLICLIVNAALFRKVEDEKSQNRCSLLVTPLAPLVILIFLFQNNRLYGLDGLIKLSPLFYLPLMVISFVSMVLVRKTVR